jgi:hypothetical protein
MLKTIKLIEKIFATSGVAKVSRHQLSLGVLGEKICS